MVKEKMFPKLLHDNFRRHHKFIVWLRLFSMKEETLNRLTLHIINAAEDLTPEPAAVHWFVSVTGAHNTGYRTHQ